MTNTYDFISNNRLYPCGQDHSPVVISLENGGRIIRRTRPDREYFLIMTYSASSPKVKEFKLTPEFKQEFGFIRASVVSGYLNLVHKSDRLIRCEFDIKNPPKFKIN